MKNKKQSLEETGARTKKEIEKFHAAIVSFSSTSETEIYVTSTLIRLVLTISRAFFEFYTVTIHQYTLLYPNICCL